MYLLSVLLLPGSRPGVRDTRKWDPAPFARKVPSGWRGEGAHNNCSTAGWLLSSGQRESNHISFCFAAVLKVNGVCAEQGQSGLHQNKDGPWFTICSATNLNNLRQSLVPITESPSLQLCRWMTIAPTRRGYCEDEMEQHLGRLLAQHLTLHKCWLGCSRFSHFPETLWFLRPSIPPRTCFPWLPSNWQFFWWVCLNKCRSQISFNSTWVEAAQLIFHQHQTSRVHVAHETLGTGKLVSRLFWEFSHVMKWSWIYYQGQYLLRGDKDLNSKGYGRWGWGGRSQ